MTGTGKSRGKTARYLAILDMVRDRITKGTYAVGSSLPSEAEFCSEFDASRFTIREALRRLQAEGLVARRQGSGSTVIRQRAEGVFLQSYQSMDDLMQFAQTTSYRRLSVAPVVLDEDQAARLGAKAGEEWTCQRGLRFEEPTSGPLALIDSFLPPDLAGFAPQLADRSPPFYAFLEEQTGQRVTDMVQEIQAVAMPTDVAEALQMPVGTACLRILRRYETDEGTLIASNNWHLGENRFIYRSRLKQSVGLE
ncbi:MAG: GntR family transcriptional regulator [Sulfitobacter sp.]